MCRITGFIDFNEQHIYDRQATLIKMRDTLAYGGPDNGGQYINENVYFGHRRLSILDLSPAGHQPMVSASGRYVIAFNGEIYNHLELRRELDQISPTPPFTKGGDIMRKCIEFSIGFWFQFLEKLK